MIKMIIIIMVASISLYGYSELNQTQRYEAFIQSCKHEMNVHKSPKQPLKEFIYYRDKALKMFTSNLIIAVIRHEQKKYSEKLKVEEMVRKEANRFCKISVYLYLPKMELRK